MAPSLIGKRVTLHSAWSDEKTIYLIVAESGDTVTITPISVAGYQAIGLDRVIHKSKLALHKGNAL